jgi:hypothetical protein
MSQSKEHRLVATISAIGVMLVLVSLFTSSAVHAAQGAEEGIEHSVVGGVVEP